MVGPAQGIRFRTPIASTAMRSREVLRMCMRLKTGSMAGTTMQKVEAPPPSRWPISAMTAVMTQTPTTLSPTSFMSLLMMTSNMPASVMMPKYSTENTNRAAVGPVLEKPDLIMAEKFSPVIQPEMIRIRARTVGQTIKAMAGWVLLLNRVTTMATMVSSPRMPTMVVFMVFPSLFS